MWTQRVVPNKHSLPWVHPARRDKHLVLDSIFFTVSFEQARVDWKIIRVVSEVVDEKLPYDKLPELRARMAEVLFEKVLILLLEIEILALIIVIDMILILGRAQPNKIRQHWAGQLLCSVFEPCQWDVTTALWQTPWCVSQGNNMSISFKLLRILSQLLMLFRFWKTSTRPTPSPEPPPPWPSVSLLSKLRSKLHMLLRRNVKKL